MKRLLQPKKRMNHNDVNFMKLSDQDLDRIAIEQITEVLNAGREAAARMEALIMSTHNDREKEALSVLSGRFTPSY